MALQYSVWLRSPHHYDSLVQLFIMWTFDLGTQKQSRLKDVSVRKHHESTFSLLPFAGEVNHTFSIQQKIRVKSNHYKCTVDTAYGGTPHESHLPVKTASGVMRSVGGLP